MVAQVKPTTKNSPPIKTGHAKNNGPAEQYAKPHSDLGPEGYSLKNNGYGENGQEGGNRYRANDLNMSVGNIQRNDFKPPKSEGIETRGNGAATKGRIARGPMA